MSFDYPSQRSGPQFPAEPMLLDTCVIQNLKSVMDVVGEGYIDNEGEQELLRRYPPPFGLELVALGDLMTIFERNGPPWVVSDSSLIEFSVLNGARGRELRRWWQEWADYFDGCLDGGWYPDIDIEQLVIRRTPDVPDGQLSMPIEPARWPLSAECVPQFGPFRNAGDRALIRDALRAGIPTILTTDIKSFWKYRRALFPLGIEIWRPTDLWKTVAHDRAIEVARWRAMLPKDFART